MSGSTETPAGWYPDPDEPGRQRYWDGQTWTEHVDEATAAEASAAAATATGDGARAARRAQAASPASAQVALLRRPVVLVAAGLIAVAVVVGSFLALKPSSGGGSPVTTDSGPSATAVAARIGCTGATAAPPSSADTAVACTFDGKPVLLGTFSSDQARDYWAAANLALNPTFAKGKAAKQGHVAAVTTDAVTAATIQTALSR